MSEIKDKVVSLEILKVAYDELKEETGQLSEEMEALKEQGIDETEINTLIEKYVTENHITGVTNEEIEAYVKQYIDENVSDNTISVAVTEWLNAHPEATTTVQNGVVTYEKLADDVKEVIDKASKSGGGSGYKYEYIGTPFPALDNYQAWAIAGVQYDKSIDRVMCLVTDADVHVSATRFKLNLYSLNPVTSEIKLVQTLKDNTVEPMIDVHSAFSSQRGFLIDNDTGIYYKFSFGNMTPSACKSEDKGVTWTDIAITETNNTSILYGDGNGQIIKTSSGRIICGLFANGFAYTDDYFKTLTYVTSGKYTVDGTASAHEYEIIEYEAGKLVAIMRKTWQSRVGEVWSGAKRIEPALLSYSEDNGTNWSFPVESTSIKNMSATNCTSFIHGDTLELYVGCRYPVYEGKYSAMFRYTVNLSDLAKDVFELKEKMFYGNTEEYINFGNLAGCVDSVGNYHLFYNDDMGSKCRWHYIKVCKATDNSSNVQEEPKNKDVQTYNATSIDSLLEAVYKHIATVKSELLLKLGELPESGDLVNPTYWVTDGLDILYKIDDEYYDATTGMISPLYATDAHKEVKIQTVKGEYDASAPETVDKALLRMHRDSSGTTDFFKDLLINSEKGYTIEIDFATTPYHASGGNVVKLLKTGLTTAWGVRTMSAWSITDYNTSVVSENTYAKIFDDTRNVNTFTWTYDKVNNRVAMYINGNEILNNNDVEIAEGYTLDFAEAFNANTQIADYWTNRQGTFFASYAGSKRNIRFYNKALSAEEVKANAIYSNS